MADRPKVGDVCPTCGRKTWLVHDDGTVFGVPWLCHEFGSDECFGYRNGFQAAKAAACDRCSKPWMIATGAERLCDDHTLEKLVALQPDARLGAKVRAAADAHIETHEHLMFEVVSTQGARDPRDQFYVAGPDVRAFVADVRRALEEADEHG